MKRIVIQIEVNDADHDVLQDWITNFGEEQLTPDVMEQEERGLELDMPEEDGDVTKIEGRIIAL